TARLPVNEPPKARYAAISVRNRSLIWRFSRSRRSWIVCMTSSRMPTTTSENSATPSNVDNTPCQEEKSIALCIFLTLCGKASRAWVYALLPRFLCAGPVDRSLWRLRQPQDDADARRDTPFPPARDRFGHPAERGRRASSRAEQGSGAQDRR